ncbi:hypothetical protein HYFRA_00007271 [Hymenoscyphus fraxineus]|uniref:Blue (type 1) copper domain-containing protein n=1 Tax=Hymenoscyphus fraxineus TaxID=746836 RepID=A0A9N9KSJ7_9HELO|nr:hypothetical protein HYFRA_00007271 [Hymenoscyphus fraxineus]
MFLSLLSVFLALPLTLASPTIIKVGDENASLTFSPSVVSVPVGEIIEFRFYPMTHSVAQGTFEEPCKPLSNSSFWSGPFATKDPKGNATTFSITVKDDKPIYYYCAFPSHCGKGMVGIVNPPAEASKGMEVYTSNSIGKSTIPSTKVQGGIVGPAAAVNSTSGSTSSAPSPTSSSGGSPAPASSSSPSASGAERGFGAEILGVGVFAVFLAGLMV